MQKKGKVLLLAKLSDHGLLLGLLFALLAIGVLCFSIFSHPRLGAVDFGEYDEMLPKLGLRHTEETLAMEGGYYFTHVVEEYDYAQFSYMQLLAPAGAPGLIYPVALVRALTNPFGLRFSTVYLAIALIALTAFALFLAVRYAYAFLRGAVCVPAMLVLLLLSDVGFAAFYNSLYTVAFAFSTLLLFIGCLLRAVVYRGAGRPYRGVLPLLFSGMLFCGAGAEMVIIFIPATVFACAVILWMHRPERGRRLIYFLITGFFLVTGVFSALENMQSSLNIRRFVSPYQAAFSGLLKYSPDPSADLASLGLDNTWLPDVGRSYYETDEEFAHDPKDEAVQAELASHLGAWRLLSFYSRNPQRMINIIQTLSPYFHGYMDYRIAPIDDQNVEVNADMNRVPLARTLRALFYPSGMGLVVALFLPAAAALITFFWPRRGMRGARLFVVIFLPFVLTAILYLPVRILQSGDANFDLVKISFMYLTDMCLFVSAGVALYLMDRVFKSINGKPVIKPKAPEAINWHIGIFKRLQKAGTAVAESPARTAACIIGLAVFMTLWSLLIPPRAGTVNNGDYGRMMDQLGLYWSEDVASNKELEAGHSVVEEYAYREDLDLLRLTSLKPSYSLIYPATLVRLFCMAIGQPFQTNYISFVMAGIALLCICLLAKDLYAFYGKWTLITGVLLALMLFGELYLVWFNSLFGEGSVYLGVLMLVTCAVRLSVLPRGKGGWLLLPLGFACRFLLASKAQMLISLPICLMLMAVFAVYHLPKGWMKRAGYTLGVLVMCALFTYNGLVVYQGNSEISEKDTIWQSVFYGLLMISDDPLADMEDLGIDPAMAADIGKHAFYLDEDYVYPIRSQLAQENFYDHVNTFSVAMHYLRHPSKLYYMLNRAASESKTLHTGFMTYVGERYDLEHSKPDRFGFWAYMRAQFAGSFFLFYVVVYGLMLAWFIRRLLREPDIKVRLYTVVLIAIMFIGALQFPLTTIGNGFADNNKQLFGFMLCHDYLVILAGMAMLKQLVRRAAKRNAARKDTNKAEAVEAPASMA